MKKGNQELGRVLLSRRVETHVRVEISSIEEDSVVYTTSKMKMTLKNVKDLSQKPQKRGRVRIASSHNTRNLAPKYPPLDEAERRILSLLEELYNLESVFGRLELELRYGSYLANRFIYWHYKNKR